MFHALCAKASELIGKGVGGAQPNISQGTIKDTTIYLPPLEEQKRIAAILDQADALRRKRQHALTRLNQLGQAIFYEICNGNKHNSNLQSLSSLLEDVQIGPFGSLLHKSDYVENGVPLINPMHIIEGQIAANPAFSVSPSKLKTLNRYLLKEGDIIMGRRGEMGRCAVASSKHVGYVCGTGSMILKCNRTKVLPEFLAELIRSPQTVSALENAASGVTMANLNQKSLDKILVKFPTMSIQNKYTLTKNRLMDQISVSKLNLIGIDRLFASLQHRAFQGKL